MALISGVNGKDSQRLINIKLSVPRSSRTLLFCLLASLINLSRRSHCPCNRSPPSFCSPVLLLCCFLEVIRTHWTGKQQFRLLPVEASRPMLWQLNGATRRVEMWGRLGEYCITDSYERQFVFPCGSFRLSVLLEQAIESCHCAKRCPCWRRQSPPVWIGSIDRLSTGPALTLDNATCSLTSGQLCRSTYLIME